MPDCTCTNAWDQCFCPVHGFTRPDTELTRLRAAAEQMAQALRPFVEQAYTDITIGDIVAARKALDAWKQAIKNH